MTPQTQFEAFLYMVSVLIPICIVAWRAPKADHFPVRFVLSVAGVAAVQACMMIVIGLVGTHPDLGPVLIWLHSGRFLEVYLLSAVLVRICFAADWWGAFFCANVGYCVQHIGARVGSAMESFLLPPDIHWLALSVVTFLANCLVTVLFWQLTVRQFPRNSGLKPENRAQILCAALVCGFEVGYNSFGISFAYTCAEGLGQLGLDPAPANGSLMFVYVTSVLIAFLALALNLDMSRNRMLMDENKALEFILAESKRKYEMEQRNIETINIKCHDLKHQIGAMQGKLYAEQIEELGNALNVYDATIQTGNETLDLILSQKTLYCGGRGIRLTCLLDGTHYGFIPRHELYALFDNALDNAIEAVEQLPEEQRVISVTENVRGDFLSVCVENYFDGSLTMKDGLPQSEKPGEGHGYGVKSIRLIAERNGGEVSFSCEDGKFTLSIYFLAA